MFWNISNILNFWDFVKGGWWGQRSRSPAYACRIELSRLSDRGLTFSKKREYLTWHLHLAVVYYHFVRPHGSLRQRIPQPIPTRGNGLPKKWEPWTPAMASGVTDHVWTMKELLTFPRLRPITFQVFSALSSDPCLQTRVDAPMPRPKSRKMQVAGIADLGGMSRTYSIGVELEPRRSFGPFYVTAGLSWRWDALQSARTATTEEDVLIELFGQEGYRWDTEQPWLRVDVTLRVTLPQDSPAPMPEAGEWRRWAREVTGWLAPLLPDENRQEKDGQVVTAAARSGRRRRSTRHQPSAGNR